MAEGLHFGFRGVTLENDRPVRQLVVTADREVYRLAQERDAEFSGILAVLTGQEAEEEQRGKFLELTGDPAVQEEGLSFAIDMAAIGRLRRVKEKLRRLEQVNQLVGGLATAAFPLLRRRPLAEREVRFEAYHPSVGEQADAFTMLSHVYLPLEVPDEVLASVAHREMVDAAKMVRLYPNVRLSTGAIGANVDRWDEVTLSQSMHSSIRTLGDEWAEGDPVVRLFGNNLEPHEAPFYAIGATALAHAAGLVRV